MLNYKYLYIVIIVFVGLSGRPSYSESRGEVLAVPRSEVQKYDILYPIHLEVCSGTQWNQTGHKPGGEMGHAFLFIKGACRDDQSATPRIKVCDKAAEGADEDENSGVGISVNPLFENANWIAVPGRKLFFSGNMGENDSVDEKSLEALYTQLEAKHIYSGIRIHQDILKYKSAHDSLERFLIKDAVATDYGIQLGRNIYCAKIPLNAKMLRQEIQYLNSLNDQYSGGKKTYKWDMVTDNCAHVVYNAAAALSLVSFKKTDSGVIEKLFNLAIPGNVISDILIKSNDPAITNAKWLYAFAAERKSIESNDYIPFHNGVILGKYEFHSKNNSVFKTKETLQFLDLTKYGPTHRHWQKIMSDPVYNDIKSNLLYFQKIYSRLYYSFGSEGRGDSGFHNFLSLYHDELDSHLYEVNKDLWFIDSLEGSTAHP